MKAFVYFLFFALLILHQDFWWWDSDALVLGFMPIALAFHAAFSITCAVLGMLAIKGIWPHELEKLSDGPSEPVAPDAGSRDSVADDEPK